LERGGILDCPGEHQGADDAGEGRDCALAPACCSAAPAQLRETVQLCAHMRGHAAAHVFALPRHLGAQSRDGAAIRPVGSVPFRQVVKYDSVQVREMSLSIGAPLERARHRFGGKLVL
jgi:hypothetical protein